MDLLKVSPRHSLGQNFLINDFVVTKIIKKACPESFETVFEVGPGFGALTNSLKDKSKKLILIEFDKKLSQFWKSQNFKVREIDALRFDWKKNLLSRGSKLLVSNLPYQIASRLLVELSILEKSFNRMILMFQKEVAQRILADPGSHKYGFLTVIAQCYWDIHPVVEAGTVDFYPRPKVASQALSFDRKKQINLNQFPQKDFTGRTGLFYENLLSRKADLLIDKKENLTYSIPVGVLENSLNFSQFVKKAFSNRRKKLISKLKESFDKERLSLIFKNLNLSENVRVENLTPGQFVQLALHLSGHF